MRIQERYTDVRQFLESVRGAKAEAARYSVRAAELRVQCESITAPLRENAVSNGNKDPHGDVLLIALAEAERKAEVNAAKWIRLSDEVDEFIDRIDSPEQRIVLRLRYTDCMRWQDVLENMKKFGLYYEERQMFRLHGAALQSARRLWNKEEHL